MERKENLDGGGGGRGGEMFLPRLIRGLGVNAVRILLGDANFLCFGTNHTRSPDD